MEEGVPGELMQGLSVRETRRKWVSRLGNERGRVSQQGMCLVGSMNEAPLQLGPMSEQWVAGQRRSSGHTVDILVGWAAVLILLYERRETSLDQESCTVISLIIFSPIFLTSWIRIVSGVGFLVLSSCLLYMLVYVYFYLLSLLASSHVL